MLSLKTKLSLTTIIKDYTSAEIDLILAVFGLQAPQVVVGQQPSRIAKANVLFIFLRNHGDEQGPLGQSNAIDALQYVVDKFYDENKVVLNGTMDLGWGEPLVPAPEIKHEDYFSSVHERLANHLQQDGFIIKERKITPLLPNQLVSANVESELERLLRKFGFLQSLGHLEQGIEAHGLSNWAGANAQFRTFLESLFIEISQKLIPGVVVADYGQAMTQLTNVTPPFFSTVLNEVKSQNINPNLNTPFINGLFKRYHPQGSHPGLSDKEDCTFRYHMAIVFARYLLDRLETRP